MTKKPLLILLVLSGLQISAIAQSKATDSVWLETNNLRVCLRNDGSLYSGGQGGAIQFRQETPNGDKWITVVKEAGLWLGGVDPAGNLMLTVHQNIPPVKEFFPGIEGVLHSDKIWRVTYDEVVEHLRDFAADGIIDHPVASIFNWPGRDNRFSKVNNGFTPPKEPYLSSAYFYKHHYGYNSAYQPDKGDYPHFPHGYFSWPDQLYCFAFQSVSEAGQFPNQPYPIQGWCYAYSFDCPENKLLNNSIFLSYVWQFRDMYPADSSVIGLYINPDIGNPNDDYHGCHRYNDFYFAYNADSLDEGGFQSHAPFLAIQTIRPPIDTFGLAGDFRVMPVGPAVVQQGNPPYMASPDLPLEFYRYLTCSWKNGSPLTIGGDGYGQEQTTTLAFPGNPFQTGVWSEFNSKNLPGDRRAVLSWIFDAALPLSINSMTLMISVVPPNDTLATAFENYEAMKIQLSREQTWFTGFGPSFDPTHDCVKRAYAPFNHYIVRAYPNPANDVLHIQMEGRKPRTIRLYDCFQRMIREINRPFDDYLYLLDNPIDLPVHDLPPGMYYLEATSWETIETVVQKVLVVH